MIVEQNDYCPALEIYKEQKDCLYKGELYSVRDNGAVYRHKPSDRKNPRRLDEDWTFGSKDKNGYMVIGSHRVHIIVATAFMGNNDSTKFIVDHIDTNKCNNCVENLRWLTRLEKALSSPVIRKRIAYLCGGNIEHYLKAPSCLKDLSGTNQDILWMGAVTPEEARKTYERVMNRILKKNEVGFTVGICDSLTHNAKQKRWKTPTQFPLCPQNLENASLNAYRSNLSLGGIITKNQYSDYYIDEFEVYDNKLYIRAHTNSGVKPFSLITIWLEEGFFIHQCDTFFKEQGAKKYFTISIGKEWDGPDGIDDYC